MLWEEEFLDELIYTAINGEVGRLFDYSPVVFQGAALPWRECEDYKYEVSFMEPIGEIGMLFHLITTAGLTLLKIPAKYIQGVQGLDMLENDFNQPPLIKAVVCRNLADGH